MVTAAALNWLTPFAPPPLVWPTTTVAGAALALSERMSINPLASARSNATTAMLLIPLVGPVVAFMTILLRNWVLNRF
jgi:hypothetical protein